MAKEILITASIGILKDNAGRHYLQIITADNYEFYYAEISARKAKELSDSENIEIDDEVYKIHSTTHNIITSKSS